MRHWLPDEVDSARLVAANERTNFGTFTRPSRVGHLSYELRPGTELRWNQKLFLAISPHGPWRIPVGGERAVPPGALRVAVVGDSTSFGWRVPFDASYPERFRGALEARIGHPVALRNVSVPGYDSEQERIVFERWVVPWRPDLVVLHYDHNDWEPPIREKPASYLDPAVGDNPLRSALWKLAVRRSATVLENRRRDRMVFDEHDLHDGYAFRGPLYDHHLAALSAIGSLAAAGGIPVVVVLFDARLERDAAPLESEHYRRLHEPLLPRLEAAGFEPLDLYPALQALFAAQGWDDQSPLWLAPNDAHPNVAGHQWIADRLLEFVLARSALHPRLAGAP